MSEPLVDTDVIIRLLSRDDLQKQREAAALFEQVRDGHLTMAAPDTVIADAVYVLSSPRLYNLPRSQVRDLLAALLRFPGFRVSNRQVVVRALDLYADSKLDFGDAMIVASMEQAGSRLVFSYDTHFDHIPSIARRTPGSS